MAACFWENLKGVVCMSEPAADLIGNTPDNPMLKTDLFNWQMTAFDSNDGFTQSKSGATVEHTFWVLDTRDQYDMACDNGTTVIKVSPGEVDPNAELITFKAMLSIHNPTPPYATLGESDVLLQYSGYTALVNELIVMSADTLWKTDSGSGFGIFQDDDFPSVGNDYLLRYAIMDFIKAPGLDIDSVQIYPFPGQCF